MAVELKNKNCSLVGDVLRDVKRETNYGQTLRWTGIGGKRGVE